MCGRLFGGRCCRFGRKGVGDGWREGGRDQVTRKCNRRRRMKGGRGVRGYVKTPDLWSFTRI
jgi:hypothetical protein